MLRANHCKMKLKGKKRLRKLVSLITRIFEGVTHPRTNLFKYVLIILAINASVLKLY